MEPVRIDIRESGGGITEPENQVLAIQCNAKANYLADICPVDGYNYPGLNSLVVDVPYTLLEDYGGNLTEGYVRELVEKHIEVETYPIIRYCGVIPEIVLDEVGYGVGYIDLTWYKEDPDYTFNIYYSQYKDSGFTLLVGGIVGSIYMNNTYRVDTLNRGTKYYFYITAVSPSDIESPKSQTFGCIIP